MGRPVLFVLAGVNGAGKSSIGGHLLRQAGLTWFNPDTFARELVATTGCGQTEANATAWQEGLRRLDEALAKRQNFAFETTLGGNTVAARIAAAAPTHDVVLWYCGLSSPALHIARVQARVAAGGHDIPEAKIHERWHTSLQNLIALLPQLSQLQVYDNSAQVEAGEVVADPLLVAEMRRGKLTWPTTLEALRATPQWAKPLLEAALSMSN
ncbi:MAG: AAA family ATPase [Burkholderiaceae bacterium]